MRDSTKKRIDARFHSFYLCSRFPLVVLHCSFVKGKLRESQGKVRESEGKAKGKVKGNWESNGKAKGK